MFNKFTIIFFSPVFLFSLNTMAESDTTEYKGYDFSGLYFSLGGGESYFSGYQNSQNITSLRYGIGYDFSVIKTELAYRGYSDRNSVDLDGLDVFLKKNISEFNDFEFSAGLGAYLYHSDLNFSGSQYGISPLLNIGLSYHFNEFLHLSASYEWMFNTKVSNSPDRSFEDKDSSGFLLSLIFYPWASKDYSGSLIVEDTIDDKPFLIVETPLYQASNDSDIYDYNSYLLSEQVKSLLDDIVEELGTLNKYKIILIGSADSQKKYRLYNRKLAEKRAETVSGYLQSKGIDTAFIEIKSSIYHLNKGEGENQNARKVTIEVYEEK